jgi:hypothetical protein
MSAILEMIFSIVTADQLLPVGIVATRLGASCCEESRTEGKRGRAAHASPSF